MNIKKRNKYDKGVTLIETLVAITIFTIISGILAVFFISTISNIKTHQAEIIYENKLIFFQQMLSKEFRKIKIPYWYSGKTIEVKDGDLSIPWYEGDEEKLLTLTNTEKGITLKTPSIEFLFSDLTFSDTKFEDSNESSYITMKAATEKEKIEFGFRFSGFGIPVQ